MKDIPVLGETWALTDDSPWPTPERAKIIAVKEDWVRFRIINGDQDVRMKLNFFCSCYRRVDEKGDYND